MLRSGEPSKDEKAVLDVKRALVVGTSLDDFLFRVNVPYKTALCVPLRSTGAAPTPARPGARPSSCTSA